VRKHLEHRNIIPFLGVTTIPLQLISEWMPNGELIEYIKKHPSVDRLRLVCAPAVVFDPCLPPPPISYPMSLQGFTFSTPLT